MFCAQSIFWLTTVLNKDFVFTFCWTTLGFGASSRY